MRGLVLQDFTCALEHLMADCSSDCVHSVVSSSACLLLCWRFLFLSLVRAACFPVLLLCWDIFSFCVAEGPCEVGASLWLNSPVLIVILKDGTQPLNPKHVFRGVVFLFVCLFLQSGCRHELEHLCPSHLGDGGTFVSAASSSELAHLISASFLCLPC